MQGYVTTHNSELSHLKKEKKRTKNNEQNKNIQIILIIKKYNINYNIYHSYTSLFAASPSFHLIIGIDVDFSAAEVRERAVTYT
jgi:hypothetical protein